MTVSNVANLPLVGTSSGVDILCVSLSFGFHIEEFTGVKVENMMISYCSAGLRYAAVVLVNGSEVTIDHVTIPSISEYEWIGVVAEDVVGSLSIINSIIYSGTHFVNHPHCKMPTLITFVNNTLKDNGFFFWLMLLVVQMYRL